MSTIRGSPNPCVAVTAVLRALGAESPAASQEPARAPRRPVARRAALTHPSAGNVPDLEIWAAVIATDWRTRARWGCRRVLLDQHLAAVVLRELSIIFGPSDKRLATATAASRWEVVTGGGAAGEVRAGSALKVADRPNPSAADSGVVVHLPFAKSHYRRLHERADGARTTVR